MKFLCGRPGCGQESTATLQIDAVSSTVSLVDPRTSRDGVPLCARHADSTTPPIGWAMNDMRSTAQAIDSGDGSSGGIDATPPRARPDRVADRGARKMSRRQSIAERARQEAVASAESDDRDRDSEDLIDDEYVDVIAVGEDEAADETLFDGENVGTTSTDRAVKRSSRRSRDEGPDSRPARRREATEPGGEDGEDAFPWHFQFDEDDEPAELQASSPLLSRAFRASTG